MKKGFSTLFIVIILGSIALALAISVSTSSVRSIQNSQMMKYSNQAKILNQSCAEIALETIRENNGYAGADTFTVNDNTCTYTVSNMGGTTRMITVESTVNNATSRLEIFTGSFNPLSIISWQEII